MLVGERMSHPVKTVSPDLPIAEALALMKHEHIRRTPVIQHGKLVGIVSDKDLLNASPPPSTALSVWEMNYLLSKITIKDVMTRKVRTVSEDTPIEEAARIMADHKIGGLPVLRGDTIVGIITETDLFKVFIELMGAREPGVRASVVIQEQKGQLARITQAIAAAGGNFVAFGQFSGPDASKRLVTFKVDGLDPHQLRAILTPLVESVTDLRAN